MSVADWIEVHPNLVIGIILLIPAVIIAIWAVRDARKRLGRIHEIENILLKMFNLALGVASAKAQTIKLDEQWDTVMKLIAKEVVGIDSKKWANKDMRDRREIAKIEKDVRKTTPTDDVTVPIFEQIASAMENNRYGIAEELKKDKKSNNLKRELAELRKVPSEKINNAINKCLRYIYILSRIYIYHMARMRKTTGIGEATLADMRNFIRNQEENTGDISKCLTELRIEVNNFVGGKNDR